MRQPVDLSSLQELRGLQQPGKPDAIARIVTLFLTETAQRITILRAAVDADDARRIEGEAHALKGISGTVGANEILDVAVRLEQFARDGHIAAAGELVTELELALVRARPIFDQLRGAA